MKIAQTVISSGRYVVSENTSLVVMVSKREPEKYALAIPPKEADPQHKDCNPPATAWESESLAWTATATMDDRAGRSIGSKRVGVDTRGDFGTDEFDAGGASVNAPHVNHTTWLATHAHICVSPAPKQQQREM